MGQVAAAIGGEASPEGECLAAVSVECRDAAPRGTMPAHAMASAVALPSAGPAVPNRTRAAHYHFVTTIPTLLPPFARALRAIPDRAGILIVGERKALAIAVKYASSIRRRINLRARLANGTVVGDERKPGARSTTAPVAGATDRQGSCRPLAIAAIVPAC